MSDVSIIFKPNPVQPRLMKLPFIRARKSLMINVSYFQIRARMTIASVTTYLTEEKSKTVVAVDANAAAERIPVVPAGLPGTRRHIQRLSLLLLPLSLPLRFLLLVLTDRNISRHRRRRCSNTDTITITITPSESRKRVIKFCIFFR